MCSVLAALRPSSPQLSIHSGSGSAPAQHRLIDFITGRFLPKVPIIHRADDEHIKQEIMCNAFWNQSARASEVTNGRRRRTGGAALLSGNLFRLSTIQNIRFDIFVPDVCVAVLQHLLPEHDLAKTHRTVDQILPAGPAGFALDCLLSCGQWK